MYHSNVINSFPESKRLYDSLDNPNYLRRLLEEKRNRFRPSVKVYGKNINILDIGLSYILYKLKNDKNSLNPNRIKILRDTLFDVFQNYPLLSYELPVFKREFNQLLFTNDQLAVINNYIVSRNNKADKTYREFERGIVDESSMEELLFLAQSWLNSPVSPQREERCEKLYGYLLNKNQAKLSLVELEFIAKYTTYLNSKDLDMPIHPVVFSDYYSNNTMMEYSVGGFSQGLTGIVFINRERAINNEKLLMFADMQIDYCTSLVETISHENRHSSQKYRAQKIDSLDEYSFDYAVKDAIGTIDDDEYDRNYSNQQVEIDAEVYGWGFVAKQLEKHAPDKAEYIEEAVDHCYQKRVDKSLAFKKSAEGRYSQQDYFDLLKLDEAILKNNWLLDRYPILLQFYSRDGKRKDFFDKGINVSVNKQSAFDKIKMRFLKVDIFNKRMLADLDIEALPLQQKVDLYYAIMEILEKNRAEIKSSMLGLQRNSKRSNTFSALNRSRLKESMRLLEYLREHKHDIFNANDLYYQKTGTSSHLKFNFDIAFNNYGVMADKDTQYTVVKESSILDYFEKLSDGNYREEVSSGRKM